MDWQSANTTEALPNVSRGSDSSCSSRRLSTFDFNHPLSYPDKEYNNSYVSMAVQSATRILIKPKLIRILYKCVYYTK